MALLMFMKGTKCFHKQALAFVMHKGEKTGCSRFHVFVTPSEHDLSTL